MNATIATRRTRPGRMRVVIARRILGDVFNIFIVFSESEARCR
jgi:DUF1365 family protein